MQFETIKLNNMKKITLLLILFLSVVTSSFALNNVGDTFQYHGFLYTVTSIRNYNGTLSVKAISNSSLSGDVVIDSILSITTSAPFPHTYNFQVTSISNNGFSGCSEITSIKIPYTMQSIGNNAFSGCTGLTSINIPKDVSSIGTGVLSGCYNIESIIVDSENAEYDSRNNCNAIINSTTNSLIAGCKDSFIPNTVNSLGDASFINISSLTSIEIPSTIQSIGSNVFYGCNGLKTVTWNIKSYSDFTSTASSQPFNGLTGITSFIFGNGVEKIPSYICNGLSGLTSLTIPNSTQEIGTCAFSGCSSLISVSIPSSVNYI